jgi:hypothetical protein
LLVKKTHSRGKKEAKQTKKTANRLRAPWEGYVVVKKDYLDELLALKRHLNNMERILKSARKNSF